MKLYYYSGSEGVVWMPNRTLGDQRWTAAGQNSAGDPMYERDLSAGSSDYGSMSKAELEAALEAKGLPKSGNKDELIARLQDA